MSKIQVTAEDVKAYPQLEKHEGSTIEASEYNKAIGLEKVNNAPKTKEIKEEDVDTKEAEVKTKRK